MVAIIWKVLRVVKQAQMSFFDLSYSDRITVRTSPFAIKSEITSSSA